MHLQTAEMNRFARDLYRRALEFRFQAKDGDDVLVILGKLCAA